MASSQMLRSLSNMNKLALIGQLSPLKGIKTSNFFSSSKAMENSSRLSGKVALVTASTEGIGLAIARKLGQDGAKVIISSRRKKNVDSALEMLKKEGLDVLGTVCHVGEEKDRNHLVEFAVKNGGGIDILVSNAAVNPAVGPLLETSEPVWDKVFGINVKNAFQLSQLVVPEMEKRNGGAIVFISSVAAYTPMPMLGVYSVSKTALLGLSKAMAGECAHLNIRVNAVCPGVINTKFSAPLFANNEMMDKFLDTLLIKRAGEPHEIGGIVSFLCSDEASYISGESFTVTGGIHSRL